MALEKEQLEAIEINRKVFQYQVKHCFVCTLKYQRSYDLTSCSLIFLLSCPSTPTQILIWCV